MLVEQLIEILKTKDPKLECLVDGYEGGLVLFDKDKIQEVDFVERSYKMSYHGDFEEATKDLDVDYRKGEVRKGLVFLRYS